jgi:hypothetical protein
VSGGGSLSAAQALTYLITKGLDSNWSSD